MILILNYFNNFMQLRIFYAQIHQMNYQNSHLAKSKPRFIICFSSKAVVSH